jgi:hypothetical protein
MNFEVDPIGVGVGILLTVGGFLFDRLRRRARSSNDVGRLSGRPKEIWNGHPVWVDVETNEDDEPIAGLAEIGVASPARLLIRRRSRFRLTMNSLPRIDVPAVNETLDVRGDDAAFAHRLFADRVMVKTLPLALKGGGEVNISSGIVRVRSPVIDHVAKDAFEAAKATAKAVVSALNLPAPQL